ncbi:hypothetical protein CLU86_0586 [Acidovorax sp. 62]|uniref:hypothetical protein n=1 Tax=Acidovorax sp. 62 TaxID=2035203 RepID=UPI000C185A20|nr:hypothetical protein [Acidovorax sp. 62]PIF89709.1 hypothetical protein CLU86_0586 [Acidovorax sp. 62]
MPIELRKNKVVFKDVVGVEDAETILAWLQKKPGLAADLSACSHLHPANLQVLLAAQTKVLAWPNDLPLRGFIESVFISHEQQKGK